MDAQDGSLVGTSWALVGTWAAPDGDAPDSDAPAGLAQPGYGALVVPVPAGARDPGLAVEQADGGLRLTLRTGCNSGSAPVMLGPGDAPGTTAVRVGDVVTTRTAGPPEVMALEADVLAVLAARPLTAVRDGGTLVVSGGGRALVLRRR